MKRLINFGFVIQLVVIILNPWFWLIIQRNILAALLGFSLSLVVFLYFWQVKSKKLLLVLSVLTVILFVISVSEAFDESIFRNSALDIQRYNKRHEFYAKSLGKIYTNRISLAYFKYFNLPLYKLQSNFFANLDPNLYFFASHPRERTGVEEFQKYLPVFLPFFVLGFISIIYKSSWKILTYVTFIAVISSIISPKYNLGPILFFPVINLLITTGVLISFQRTKGYLRRIHEI